jgi:hypothetical protein
MSLELLARQPLPDRVPIRVFIARAKFPRLSFPALAITGDWHNGYVVAIPFNSIRDRGECGVVVVRGWLR